MKINFRIDWGSQFLYSSNVNHPTYIWDGKISCVGGEITEVYLLDYPKVYFGPVYSPKEIKLETPQWKCYNQRFISGIRVVAEVEDDAVFHFETVSKTVSIPVNELLGKGRLEYPVGPKYLCNTVMVTLEGHLWFRMPLKAGETAFEPEDFGLPCHSWSRMNLAWIEPGQTAKWEYEVKDNGADSNVTLFHTVAMVVPRYSDEGETQYRVDVPLEIICDGETVYRYERHYRFHDGCVQLLEDDFKYVKLAPGKHLLELKNCHDELCIGLNRIIMSQCEANHGDIFAPAWCLKSETIVGRVFSKESGKIEVNNDGKTITVDCKEGWNEFELTFERDGNIEISTASSKTFVEVFDCEEEEPSFKIGYDMTVVPHDDNGFMDHVLKYTHEQRLGNYVVFRNFLKHWPSMVPRDPDAELLYKWGDYCRRHGIYVSAATDYQNGRLAEGAKEMLHDCGLHEWTRYTYTDLPREPYASANMKEASENFIAYVKEKVDEAHTVSKTAAFGDASGGIRYTYLAGTDFVRAETMVGHTCVLLSQARPAAEALGNGSWGVHIAIQHAMQPYHENHLGQYYLSLAQAWMMGAEVLYEEDSLFNLFKEERQVWDDLLVKGKREITKAFYKFAKTHPRRSKSIRNIAFIEGRYAAPFCGFNSAADDRIWGMFGKDDPLWANLQPEKCRHLLNVLMPGANVSPLRQKNEHRRYFFSGNPYGDFDCIPTEGSVDYFKNYKLLLHLGWNTMIDEDHAKLKEYVENGGVLLTAIPEFSTHIGREFLRDMEDLALYRDGNLTELCGIKVNGKGKKYGGQWNCENRDTIEKPELISLPNDHMGEDGIPYLADVTLQGAEVVAWDMFSGQPILVRNKVGKGYVYTFTYWAYPGHESYQELTATWIKKLAAETLGDEYVVDPTNEVFWTRGKEGDTTVFNLINTDWTERGNVKTVDIVTADGKTPIEVKERTLVTVRIKDGKTECQVYSFDVMP